MTPKIFRSTHRAHFSELDLYGHMNSEHYFKYFLNHRFHGMRENDLDLKKIMDLPIAFVLRKSEVKFVRPIYGDETFFITSYVEELKNFTALVSCKMKNEKGEILSKCKMQLACVDKKDQKPVRWPKGLFETYFFESLEPIESLY